MMFRPFSAAFLNSPLVGKTTATQGFRDDINGLRAIAVSLVVLFHFGISPFQGGYVGVDVFFVISGYLMTRIIVGGLANNRFSLVNFYLARARRILPGLAILCLTLLIYGVIQMTPPDLERLGRHVAESLTFTSNIFYWSEFNYFSADNFDKWLLHTWSLSVEWQFYLLFPIVLLQVSRSGKLRYIPICLMVLFVASFAASVLFTRSDAVFSFYMLPTRAWEMLAGGIVAISPAALQHKYLKSAVALLGLALIAFSTLQFDAHTKWPGVRAALPVFGACLYIYADLQSRLVRNPLVGLIGTASYSIYLWHWPVVALMHHYSLETSLQLVWVGIIVSVGLGWASQRFVEAPALKALQLLRPQRSWAAVLSAAGAVAGLGIAIVLLQGMPQRPQVAGFADAASEIAFAKMRTGWCHADFSDLPVSKTKDVKFEAKYENCYIGDLKSNLTAILWGDSHAAHFAPYIDIVAKAQGVKVQQLTSPGCKPLFDGNDVGTNPDICLNFRKAVLEKLSGGTPVIIGARWDNSASYSELDATLDRTLKRLSDANAKVILLGETPVFPTSVDQKFIYEKTFAIASPHKYNRNASVDHANIILRAESEKYKNVIFIDPGSRLCTGSTCTPLIQGHEVYFNADHLTIMGAQTLAKLDLADGHVPSKLLIP